MIKHLLQSRRRAAAVHSPLISSTTMIFVNLILLLTLPRISYELSCAQEGLLSVVLFYNSMFSSGWWERHDWCSLSRMPSWKCHDVHDVCFFLIFYCKLIMRILGAPPNKKVMKKSLRNITDVWWQAMCQLGQSLANLSRFLVVFREYARKNNHSGFDN